MTIYNGEIFIYFNYNTFVYSKFIGKKLVKIFNVIKIEKYVYFYAYGYYKIDIWIIRLTIAFFSVEKKNKKQKTKQNKHTHTLYPKYSAISPDDMSHVHFNCAAPNSYILFYFIVKT